MDRPPRTAAVGPRSAAAQRLRLTEAPQAPSVTPGATLILPDPATGPAFLAVDPGYTQSAWLLFAAGRPVAFSIEDNEDVIRRLREWHDSARIAFVPFLDAVVIEQVESFGMAVGREVFETVRWAGRFEEACHPTPVAMLPRRAVKLHLCASPRANDSNIRQALLDRFGGSSAVGRKASPGPLYGIHADVWSALAIAVTFAEREPR